MSQPGDDSGTHSPCRRLPRRASEDAIHVHAEDILKNVEGQAVGASSSHSSFWGKFVVTLWQKPKLKENFQEL